MRFWAILWGLSYLITSYSDRNSLPLTHFRRNSSNQKDSNNLKTLQQLALKKLSLQFGLDESELKVISILKEDKVVYFYCTLEIHGYTLHNYQTTIVMSRTTGKAIYASSNVDPDSLPKRPPRNMESGPVTLKKAFISAQKFYKTKAKPKSIKTVWYLSLTNGFIKGYLMQVRDDRKFIFAETIVDSSNGLVVYSNNFYSYYHSFHCIELPNTDYRSGLGMVYTREFSEQSERGWFSNSERIETLGNNAIATYQGNTLQANHKNKFPKPKYYHGLFSVGQRNQAILNAFYV